MTCIHLHILQYMLQIYRLFGFRASKIKIEHIYIFDELFKEAKTVHIIIYTDRGGAVGATPGLIYFVKYKNDT